MTDIDSDDVGSEWDDDGHTEASRARAVLTYLVEKLVDEPESITIESSRSRGSLKFSIHVAPDDMGKVIGRRGRVAQSIRTVVRAAGAKDGIDVLVDISD